MTTVEAGAFRGTGVLVRFVLRRDRVRVVVWVLALGLLTVYAAVALDTTYPTAAERQQRAAVMANPAAVLLGGPGYGTDDYTLGAMIANELSLSVMVAAAIMSIQMVVRHTRAEEESGRADLVRAGVVGRRAALTAVLAETALADAAVGAVVTAGLVAYGLTLADSLALGVGIALTGLVFGAVAAGTAQLTEHARAASGWALATLAAAVLVRGIGDVLRTGGSLLSWFSPLAWAQQTRAFVDLRWTPLVLSVALVAVLVAVAYRLVGRRDVGAGLVRPRPGPARAARGLSGPVALTLRLQRGSVLAWGSALLLIGLVFGSLTDDVVDMVAGNDRLQAAFSAVGGADPTDSFLAATALYLSLAVGGFAVASVLHLRTEEADGRTEVLLAAAVDRRRYLGSALLVSAGASAVLLVLAGLGTGLSAAAVRGDAGEVGRHVGALLVHLPAVLVMVGITGLLVGVVPRWSALAWLLMTWTVVIGLFGGLLSLPGWMAKTSPFGWTPALPAHPLTFGPLLALTVVAAAVIGAALAGFRRRDVPTT